ncbi:sterile alpha motif domain-containing protein 3-like [Hyalella azteca]|uniref:Sterile alpha motif domain-containing protein 3-like n=1 Tax=Hyalella azteca TaxID=294128 RepID=A0A8B7P042_HYAAZ|nr:sterile alpha motif domain-containing protein 3-like [Hyalella azteca]
MLRSHVVLLRNSTSWSDQELQSEDSAVSLVPLTPFSTITTNASASGTLDQSADCTDVPSKSSLSSNLLKWPRKFEVSEDIFPESLRKSLGAAEPLSKKQKGRVLECLYNEMKKYTYYPTSAKYNDVACSLLEKYPYLYQPLQFDDARVMWRTMLSMKARNSRQRRDRHVPCVVALRSKKKFNPPDDETTTVSENDVPTSTPATKAANLMPVKFTEEDVISAQRHRSSMFDELKKASPNQEVLEKAMSLTFSDRRRMIITEKATVAQIAEMYPVLFNANQICAEFYRLTNINVSRTVHEKMLEYWWPIHLLEEIPIPEESEFDPDEYYERVISTSLLQIPSMMNEEVDFSMASKGLDQNSFTLHFSDASLPYSDGVVVSQGNEICRVSGVREGFVVWIASYYIFNMSYPKFCKKTLSFIQRELLGLNEKIKLPLFILKTIAKLNALKNTKLTRSSLE